MVFIVIPPTDVDVGSPVDEKLMDTIRIDLDDLDTRVSTNTTAIAGIGGGGGAAGSFGNMIYFDSPGTWTSPAIVSPVASVNYIGASGGGGGGTGQGAAGGNGGASTPTTFFGDTVAGVAAVGGGSQGNSSIGGNVNLQDRISYKEGEITLLVSTAPANAVQSHLYPNTALNIQGGASGGTGGAGAWSPGARGGNSKGKLKTYSVLASTVYPVTVGQAGAGGGGGGALGGNPATGTGGGPGGGGASAGGSAPGGPGGLVPHTFLSTVGNNGLTGTSPGGSGGGTGIHGGIYLYYNEEL